MVRYSFKNVVDEAGSSEDLEEIRAELSKLTKRSGLNLGESRLAIIETKRRQLQEDEESTESEGYQTSWWKAAEPDFSDEQVRSLFSTILD